MTQTKNSKTPSSNGAHSIELDINSGLLQAIDTGWARIEFEPDGTIIEANKNFLKALGYKTLREISGKHHRIFCTEEYAESAEYEKFWEELGKGSTKSGEFNRLKKSGESIWISASYTPVKDDSGQVVRVVKLAADITETVKAKQESQEKVAQIAAQEEELRQSMEEMQAIQEEVERQKQMAEDTLEQAVDGVITINDSKIVTFYNSAAEKMFGYSKEEVLGNNVKMIVPMEHQEQHDTYVDDNVQHGEDKVIGIGRELKMVRKDGEEFWGFLALSKVKTETGFQYTAFIKDITNEREARMQAEVMKAAVDTGWASIEFEPDGTIISANDNFVSSLGYSDEEEIIGEHHKIFCESEYVDSLEYKKFWKDLAVGNVNYGEFKRITKDGKEIWINATYTPIKDGKGNVIRVIKIASDITGMVDARKQADAIKSAVDTGWASIEFEPDGTIIDANPNFVSVLGYRKNTEMIGQHHRIFCEPDYAASLEYKEFWANLAAGRQQSGEFMRITKDGREIWINASYTPVEDENGQVVKVVKIAADITAQKNVINAIQQVVREAGEQGNLGARVDVRGATGDYLVLQDSVNDLLDAIGIPVQRFKELIIELSKGNLTIEFDMDVEGDIGEMGDALNQALGNLNHLMGSINELANLVAAASEEMLVKGEQMKGSTGEMSAAIQQMAEGVQDQAQKIDDISKLIEGVLKSAKDMGKKSQVINTAAEQGKNSSKEGVKTINAVVESMTGIESAASVTSKSIDVLTERSEEIARTLNVITDIAAQTNLLALNAAIEAARAGDAGRGFAVVAEEIRKLAEDSRNSAQDIERVIKEVQKDVNSASKSIQDMDGSVRSGNRASSDAEEVFQSIDDSSEQTFNISDEILEATKLQEDAINNTVKNVEKIVVVSEETASGTEQVAASSKELSQGMDEVSASSKDLADIANQLLEGVSKFQLKSDSNVR